MPRHAHTLSCLLLGLCLPALCFHGNIRIIPCWNILNIVNSCVSQSDIADALIALISECVCLVFSSPLPRSPSQYFYSLFIIMKIFLSPSLQPNVLLCFLSETRRYAGYKILFLLVLRWGQSRYSLPCWRALKQGGLPIQGGLNLSAPVEDPLYAPHSISHN